MAEKNISTEGCNIYVELEGEFYYLATAGISCQRNGIEEGVGVMAVVTDSKDQVGNWLSACHIMGTGSIRSGIRTFPGCL